MVCGNENCIWRKNDDLQAWHCEYAYTCPYQTNKYKMNNRRLTMMSTQATKSKLNICWGEIGKKFDEQNKKIDEILERLERIESNDNIRKNKDNEP